MFITDHLSTGFPVQQVSPFRQPRGPPVLYTGMLCWNQDNERKRAFFFFFLLGLQKTSFCAGSAT